MKRLIRTWGFVVVALCVATFTSNTRAAAWTPSNMTVAAWFDAADASTIQTSGSSVTSWLDKSGNANHVAQSAPSQPVTGSTSLNALNTISFDGVDDVLVLETSSINTLPASVFVVVNDPTKHGAFVSLRDASANRGVALGMGNSNFDTAGNNMTGLKWGLEWQTTSETTLSTGTLVEAMYQSSASVAFFQNGNAVTITGGLTTAPGAPDGQLAIGGHVASRYANVDIAEVIVLERSASQMEREQIEGYLAHKWGLEGNLPGGHTYKDAPPSAPITYVDANNGNTTVNGAAMVFEPTGGYNMSDDDDAGGDGRTTEWIQRDPYANAGNVFQTVDVPSVDVLNTSVSGLAAGTYQVYAYFWDSSAAAADWDLAAELDGGGYLDKASGSAGVVAASNQLFTTSVLTSESDRTLYAIDLGTFTGTGFTVNAKGGTAGVGSGANIRTWYDGVGYVEVEAPAAPVITALSPTNNATGVSPATDLVATFSEDIFTNTTGSVVITNISDGGSATLIAIGDTDQVAVSGTSLTINPTGGLSNNTHYAVLIDTNALKDASGSFFAGITNAATWNFTTAPPDLTAPTLGSADIVDDRSGAAVDKGNAVTYTLTFSEAMDPGSISAGDFSNAGSSSVTIGTPAQADTNVFTVAVTPTSAGTLQLRVSSNVTDLAGNRLAGDVTDGDVLTVEDPWTPAEVPLSAWYDASDASTIHPSAASGPVSQWDDKNTNATHDATQGTPSLQPTTGNDINGLNAIHFDGDLMDSGLTQLTTASIYFVARAVLKGHPSNNSILQSASGVTSGGLYITLQNYNVSGQATHAVFYTSGISAADRFVNGVSAATDHGFSPAIFSHSGSGFSTEGLSYKLGSTLSAGNSQVRADMGELIICPAVHDADTRRKMEGYLAWKWGLEGNLPGDHPYKSARPSLGEPPAIVTLSPTNNATGVLSGSDLVATFSESIFTNTTGSIVLTNLSDKFSITFAIGDTNQVTVSGATLTIDPPSALSNSANYAVLIDSNALKNIAGNFFAGITNAATWSFTTVPPDLTTPALASAGIVDDRGGVSVPIGDSVTYTLTFSEAMDPASVTAGDFDNAGSSSATIGTPAQIDTNVFTVAVTPTTAGTLQLRVSSNVTDLAGNQLAGDVTDEDQIIVEDDFFDDLFTGSGSASAPGSFASDATTASAKVGDYIVDENNVNILNSGGVGNPTPALNLFEGQTQATDGTAALHLNLTTVWGATYRVRCQVRMWGSTGGNTSYTLSAEAFADADTTSGTPLGSDLISTSAGFTMETISFTFVASSTATTLYFDGTIGDTLNHNVWIDNLDINEDLSTVPPATLFLLK